MITGVQPDVQSIFQAIPLDQFGNTATLPPGVTASWTSSDPTNAPVVPVSGDQTGLLVSIKPPTSAPTTGSFELNVSASMPDGSTVSGTATVPYLPGGAAVPVVQSFAIDQVTPAVNPLRKMVTHHKAA